MGDCCAAERVNFIQLHDGAMAGSLAVLRAGDDRFTC
jgi:hypothetical protein